jgi:hypothetical protein
MDSEEASASAEAVLVAPVLLAFVWLMSYAFHAYVGYELVGTLARTAAESVALATGATTQEATLSALKSQAAGALARYGLRCEGGPRLDVVSPSQQGGDAYRVKAACPALSSSGTLAGLQLPADVSYEINVPVDPYRSSR